MRASNKRNTALLWTGIGAATAGIVAVVTILRLREQSQNESNQRERDINAVIEDCYRKISEIEEHLPKQTVTSRTRRNSETGTASVANN
jgi:hypothetical protein